jgi:outer membrane murein-binding lipoprotein Lpp
VRVRAIALATAAALVLAAAVSSPSDGRPAARPTLTAKVRALASAVRELEAKVELMELSAARYADWEACIRGVPASEYGDPDRQSGYLYDERDGTGLGYRPALAVDRKSKPRREDYLFLDFARSGNCRSDAPLPGGTAEPARASAASRRTLPDTLASLERRVRAMKRSARRLEASSEHFDAWESCVSWVPVTEYGDPDGMFGYLFGARDGTALGYRPALAIDRSDWDDPDYMFLAFVGGDRPGHRCQDEPGEGID